MRFIVRYLGDLRDRLGLTGIWIFVDWIKTILGLMESLDYTSSLWTLQILLICCTIRYSYFTPHFQNKQQYVELLTTVSGSQLFPSST